MSFLKGLSLRVILGGICIAAGIILILVYRADDSTLTQETIPAHILARAIDSAGGKRHLTGFTIQAQKRIGRYDIYAFSYDYQHSEAMSGYAIYEEDQEGYKLRMDTLTFPLKNVSAPGIKEGLHFITLDGMLIAAGVVRSEEPYRYEIKSGQTIIQEEYKRNQYFIKGYLLDRPDQFSITPLPLP